VVGDTTEFAIGDGGATLYLAAILDLYSRFVVGWAISAVNDRRLTLKALEMAMHRRCPEPGLLRHSDRECTYTCEDYQTYLATRGITCSMSRRPELLAAPTLDARPNQSGRVRTRRRGEGMDAAIPVDAKPRPQGFGKPYRTRFPTAPTPIIIVV
jgi:integrase-like protein